MTILRGSILFETEHIYNILCGTRNAKSPKNFEMPEKVCLNFFVQNSLKILGKKKEEEKKILHYCFPPPLRNIK